MLKSQLKVGAVLSYAIIIVTNIIGLLITPLMVSKLGKSEYGLYALIGAFIAYVSVLDFGLNNTIVRYIAKYRAENDAKGEREFLATTMSIYFIISFFIALIGFVAYNNLDIVFGQSFTPDELEMAKILSFILIINLIITLPGGAFTAICYGYEKFVFPKTIIIVRYLLRSLAIVILLYKGGNAIGIVIIDTIFNFLMISINASFVIKKLRVKISFKNFEFTLIKEILSYSIWIFLFGIVAQFQWKAGQVIIGIFSDTNSVAIYAIGIMLGSYYGAFSTAISGVFLPRATSMTVKNSSPKELTDMMIKIGRLSLLVLLLVLGGFFFFGKTFITLWLGNDFLEAWNVSFIIMIAYTVPLIQSFANSILEARSLFSFKTITYLLSIGIGTLVGAFLVPYFDLVGMIMGTAGGWIVGILIMNFYFNNKLELSMTRFFNGVLKNILPVYSLCLVIGYFLTKISYLTWTTFIIQVVAFSAFYSVLMYNFALNSSEKQIILGFLPNYLQKK